MVVLTSKEVNEIFEQEQSKLKQVRAEVNVAKSLLQETREQAVMHIRYIITQLNTVSNLPLAMSSTITKIEKELQIIQIKIENAKCMPELSEINFAFCRLYPQDEKKLLKEAQVMRVKADEENKNLWLIKQLQAHTAEHLAEIRNTYHTMKIDDMSNFITLNDNHKLLLGGLVKQTVLIVQLLLKRPELTLENP